LVLFYLTIIFNVTIPPAGQYLFKRRYRRNITIFILAIIPLYYLINCWKIDYVLLFFSTPLLNSLWYLLIRFFYIKDLKREPVIPGRGGGYDFDEKRYPGAADYLFMMLVLFLPLIVIVYSMTKAFPN
jgi:hypothetical protein